MRWLPRGSSRTSPASLRSRRCRETAGRLIGSVSAISRTDRPPAPSSSTMARRLGSPSASKGSPARWGVGTAVLPLLLRPVLEAVGELRERRPQVGDRAPDQRYERAGVLLPHGEQRRTVGLRGQRVPAYPPEERRTAGEGHALARRE